ncbi:MAG: hypothetical protein LBS81_04735 [Endomicrobium sp.]|nr:hypothetical protein [Endomicrobium sp.]
MQFIADITPDSTDSNFNPTYAELQIDGNNHILSGDNKYAAMNFISSATLKILPKFIIQKFISTTTEVTYGGGLFACGAAAL